VAGVIVVPAVEVVSRGEAVPAVVSRGVAGVIAEPRGVAGAIAVPRDVVVVIVAPRDVGAALVAVPVSSSNAWTQMGMAAWIPVNRDAYAPC